MILLPLLMVLVGLFCLITSVAVLQYENWDEISDAWLGMFFGVTLVTLGICWSLKLIGV